jgi:hypothetical protein
MLDGEDTATNRESTSKETGSTSKGTKFVLKNNYRNRASKAEEDDELHPSPSSPQSMSVPIHHMSQQHATNTRRHHKSTPSTGAVLTITPEATEEESESSREGESLHADQTVVSSLDDTQENKAVEEPEVQENDLGRVAEAAIADFGPVDEESPDISGFAGDESEHKLSQTGNPKLPENEVKDKETLAEDTLVEEVAQILEDKKDEDPITSSARTEEDPATSSAKTDEELITSSAQADEEPIATIAKVEDETAVPASKVEEEKEVPAVAEMVNDKHSPEPSKHVEEIFETAPVPEVAPINAGQADIKMLDETAKSPSLEEKEDSTDVPAVKAGVVETDGKAEPVSSEAVDNALVTTSPEAT